MLPHSSNYISNPILDCPRKSTPCQVKDYKYVHGIFNSYHHLTHLILKEEKEERGGKRDCSKVFYNQKKKKINTKTHGELNDRNHNINELQHYSFNWPPDAESHQYMTPGKTTTLTLWTFIGNVMSLLFNTLSRKLSFQGAFLL